MSTKKVEKIAVAELSKYGFKTEKGEYVNWGQKISDGDKGKVVPGLTYEFDLWISDSGKKYVNAVLSADKPASVPAPAPKAVAKKETPKAAEPISNGLSKEEWAAKDARISRQGLIQVAIQVTGGNFENAVELANMMLKYVQEGK